MIRVAAVLITVLALGLFGLFASVPPQQTTAEAPAFQPDLKLAETIAEDREQVEALKASIADVVQELKNLRGNIPQAEAVSDDIATLKSGYEELKGQFVSTAIQPIDTHDDEIADALSRLTNLETKLADMEDRLKANEALEKRVAALESKSFSTSSSYTKTASGGSNGTYSTTSYGSTGTTYSTVSYGSSGSVSTVQSHPVYQSYSVPVQSYQPVRNAVRSVTPPRLKLYSPSRQCYVDENGNRVCP